MLKLLKYLRPYTFLILLTIAFLFVQALCDLALPDYMSNIVNNGIQQGGIENAVPKAIRKSEVDKLILFMNEQDESDFFKYYTLYEPGNESKQDYGKFVKEFPALSTEPVYILNTNKKIIVDSLNKRLSKPMLMLYNINQGRIGGSSTYNLPEGTDILEIIKQIPDEQLSAMLSEAEKQFSVMPESMIIQSAIEYIKLEYNVLGVDMESLQEKYLLKAGILMLLIALLGAIATIIIGFMAARVSAGFGRDLRLSLFKKVEDFSNAEFDKYSTASLITRTTNDVQQIQMFTVMLFRMVFYAPILGIGGVLKVISTKTNMGWVIAVAVTVILLIVIALFNIAIPKFKVVQKLIDRLNLVTREILSGLLVIRAFNTEKHEEKRFDKANLDLTRVSLFINRTMALMMPLMMLIMNGISLLVVWVGSHQVDAGIIQVGDIMAFIQYTMQIIMSFLMISMVSIMLPRASVSANRIAEVLSVKPTITEPESPKAFDQTTKGTVEFRNVSFRYPGAEEDVLYDISFYAGPGQVIAIIGSTGSGKSTLVNLIPRFYDVTKGQVLIDGLDVREVSQKELRDKIGYVPQKGVLFSGTIESNLRFGDENASDKEIENAAHIAQAKDFIVEKQLGFNHPIAQGGTNVSGGQKQRLSIARALVKKPEIFIFDDSFSALDFKTESELRRALKIHTENSTLIIVAQRISSIMNADTIIVLDEGRIVGMGTHNELLETCEVYKEIASSQLTKEVRA